MGSKKLKQLIDKTSAEQQELSKRLAAVRGQLTLAEKKLVKAKDRAMRWKKEAKAQQLAAERAGARVQQLQRKLEKARAALKSVQSAAGEGTASSSSKASPKASPKASAKASPTASEKASAKAGPKPSESAPAEATSTPDKTWTVAQLRAEARARGITGMSNKPKAQLLAALS